MSARSCECEHVAHFEDTGHLTPNGARGHAYGAQFDEAEDLVELPTEYGKYLVCTSCATDCHGPNGSRIYSDRPQVSAPAAPTCDGCSEPRHLLAPCEVRVIGEENQDWLPASYCIDCVETALLSVIGHESGQSFNGMSDTVAIRQSTFLFTDDAGEDVPPAILPGAWVDGQRAGRYPRWGATETPWGATNFRRFGPLPAGPLGGLLVMGLLALQACATRQAPYESGIAADAPPVTAVCIVDRVEGTPDPAIDVAVIEITERGVTRWLDVRAAPGWLGGQHVPCTLVSKQSALPLR